MAVPPLGLQEQAIACTRETNIRDLSGLNESRFKVILNCAGRIYDLAYAAAPIKEYLSTREARCGVFPRGNRSHTIAVQSSLYVTCLNLDLQC